jgi:hypothetical protein
LAATCGGRCITTPLSLDYLICLAVVSIKKGKVRHAFPSGMPLLPPTSA